MLRVRWASTKPARPRSWPDAVRAAAIAACAIAALAVAGAACADFSGRVVGVADGDTLTVLVGARQVRVRLWGIDAPERGQPWSSRSRDALAARAMHRDALVATRGTDGYGRTLARVAVDGVDLGEAQLRDGMAWVYRRYTKDRAMIAIEDEARAARRGLWSLPDPEPPWAWRAREARTSDASPSSQRGAPKASPSGSLPGSAPK
ncbi:MAG: thermonuclease family protein [Betaproteobacteria bacterium]|nr:thermonuclease family protein [Betaproteobacteria bacterium]